MKSKTATLLSLGLSAALIAVGIWFLSDYHSLFGYGGRGWHMPHHRMMGPGGMGFIMILFWVMVLGAVVLVISSLLSGRSHSDRRMPDPQQDAVEILKRCYARGEIDKTQFDAMRREVG